MSDDELNKIIDTIRSTFQKDFESIKEELVAMVDKRFKDMESQLNEMREENRRISFSLESEKSRSAYLSAVSGSGKYIHKPSAVQIKDEHASGPGFDGLFGKTREQMYRT